MRIQAVIVLMFTTTAAAQAQCPIGSFPTLNSSAQTICQSAAGESRGGVYQTVCPPGAYASVDGWGRRTCSSLDEPRRRPGVAGQTDRFGRTVPYAVGRSDRYDERDRDGFDERDRIDRLDRDRNRVDQ